MQKMKATYIQKYNINGVNVDNNSINDNNNTQIEREIESEREIETEIENNKTKLNKTKLNNLFIYMIKG